MAYPSLFLAADSGRHFLLHNIALQVQFMLRLRFVVVTQTQANIAYEPADGRREPEDRPTLMCRCPLLPDSVAPRTQENKASNSHEQKMHPGIASVLKPISQFGFAICSCYLPDVWPTLVISLPCLASLRATETCLGVVEGNVPNGHLRTKLSAFNQDIPRPSMDPATL